MKWLLTSGQRSGVRDLIWGPGAAPRLWVWHPWAKIKGALDVGGNELVNVVPPWGGPVSPVLSWCPCPDVPVLSWCHLSLAPVPVTTVNWMNSVSSGGNSVLSVSVQRWLVYPLTCSLVHSLTRQLPLTVCPYDDPTSDLFVLLCPSCRWEGPGPEEDLHQVGQQASHQGGCLWVFTVWTCDDLWPLKWERFFRHL